MPEENKIRDAADAVKGIVEAVPIYQDLAQPAMQELGKGLHAVAKSVHIALAPIAALVWGYDQIKDFVYSKVAEKLAKVPPERIVTPVPNIAIPALEALRYTAGLEPLREMYANLLAASMDSETCSEAHPAFVEIIRQMTPDEAKLFNLVSTDMHANPLVDVNVKVPNGHGNVALNLSMLGVEANCERPDLTPTYIDNFVRMGLARVVSGALIAPGAYDWVEKCALQKGITNKEEGIEATILKKSLQTTSFGQNFARICTASTPIHSLSQAIQGQITPRLKQTSKLL